MKEFNRLFVESFIRLFCLIYLFWSSLSLFVLLCLLLSYLSSSSLFVSICLLRLFLPKVRLQCGEHPCPRVILFRRSGESCFSGKVTAIRE